MEESLKDSARGPKGDIHPAQPTMLLHNLQEFDNNLRAGPDQNLALARLNRASQP